LLFSNLLFLIFNKVFALHWSHWLSWISLFVTKHGSPIVQSRTHLKSLIRWLGELGEFVNYTSGLPQKNFDEKDPITFKFLRFTAKNRSSSLCINRSSLIKDAIKTQNFTYFCLFEFWFVFHLKRIKILLKAISFT